ncbi:leucine-rich repeat protein [Lawsonibacter sp. LCP25S3_G6]|uniref:leucine-rich repeat domain-containing protein n=1 Tax=unclassified Lawsonibacter TaxID=2617946 RepID=UPI003F98B937
MRTRFLSLLCVLALCFTLLPATAGAAGAGPDWTYDPEAQTLTSGDNTVTLYNVTAGGSSGTELTIGKNGSNSSGPMFNGSTLDLSGTITGTDGTHQYTITSIGDSAFYRCESLTSITLPEGVTFIGEYAFSGCASLTSVDLSRCTNLTSIGGYAFSHCNALTSIALPESVTSIGECAFQNCKELTSMSLLSKTPPTLGRYALKFFVREQDGTYPSFNLPKLTILVPLGSVEAYQAASGWSDYTGKIQAIPGTAAIACSPSSLTMTVGDTPSAITVTLTNTDMVELTNLAAALTGSGANAFTLDTLSVPSLAAGTSTTFLLPPHVGLAVGTYPVTV